MAGAITLVAIENFDPSVTAIKEQWDVEFSRFFNCPLSSTSLTLKPLRKSQKSRFRGTWLSASSPASLLLLTYDSNPELILVVSLRGKKHEEHFISNLHFFWPHLSCVYQCPTRGSRVVFASYRDGVGQIRKFALRFLSSREAQTFVNVLKVQPSPVKFSTEETLKDVLNIGYQQSSIGSDISSQSEFDPSNGLQRRADNNVNYVTSVDTYTPQMLPVNYKAEQSTCTQESALGHNFEGIFEALPPSFTALLANCCTEAEQEQPMVPEEVDLKSQITRYISDSSFNDMLCKVEKVINEMGGDLAI